MSTQVTKVRNLRIASPCPISWDEMRGDNRVRFCTYCHLNVYNISELSAQEAEKLIAATEGRLCARLFRRSDGTILTKDCPFGIRAITRKVSRVAAALFAAITSFASLTFAQTVGAKRAASCPQQAKIATMTIDPNKQTPAITGNVIDQNGALIPRVKILLKSKQGKTLNAVSDDEGKFRFDSVPPGTYSLRFEAPGFKSHVINCLILEAAHSMNLDVTMLANVEVLIGVVAGEPSLIDSPIGTTIINSEIIRRIPH